MTRLQAHKASVPVLLEYIAKLFLTRFLILLIGIAVIMQALDLLSQSGDVLAPAEAGLDSLWRLTALRFPQILSNVVTFCALLATLVTATTLAQHSEIAVMQASGLSAFRIVFPMMGVAAVIALLHFAFNETVVVDANAEYQRWQAAGFEPGPISLPPAPSDAWATEGNVRIQVGGVTRDGTILDKLRLNKVDETGKTVELTTSNFVVYDGDQWTMFDVTVFDVRENKVEAFSQLPWDTAIPPERFRALTVEPEQVSLPELQRALDQLKGESSARTRLTVWLHQKLAGPMGSILMPLLGAVAAFGVARSGAMFMRVVAGMAFGFSYLVFANFLLAIGQYGAMPPILAAWSPFLLFLCLGSALLFYTEA
ncbi:MAG: LPS export ABC transporter permease LptG [Alphaproteobacteria bacterium]